jgi:hypothetical protein
VKPDSFVIPNTHGEILPGSITETAAEITRRGGHGIGVAWTTATSIKC